MKVTAILLVAVAVAVASSGIGSSGASRAPSAARSRAISPRSRPADDGRLLAPRLPCAAARPAPRHGHASRLRRARPHRPRDRPPRRRRQRCSRAAPAVRRRLPDSPDGRRSMPTAAATSARSRRTTPRRSTAASSTARRATRSTPTAARSTSTRSRTPTSPLRDDVARGQPPVPAAGAVPARDGGRRPCARAGVRRGRLGLGRPLVRSEGLSALLGVGPLRSRGADFVSGPEGGSGWRESNPHNQLGRLVLYH